MDGGPSCQQVAAVPTAVPMWLGGTGACRGLPSIHLKCLILIPTIIILFVSRNRKYAVLSVAMSFDHDRRVLVYPDYINSRRTQAQGRKVPVPKACTDPTVQEILDCLKHFKLPAEPENKAYSRDFLVRGRVRVQLKSEDGTLINPEFPNRRLLLKRIAEFIPRHPNRQGRKPQLESKAESSAAAAAAAGQSSKQHQQQQGKKAGKKKK